MAAESKKKGAKLSKLDKFPGIHGPSLSGKWMKTLPNMWAKVEEENADELNKRQSAAFVKHIKKQPPSKPDGDCGLRPLCLRG